MSTDPTDPASLFYTQFLDDYFAECDEYLAIVRHHILALDPFVGRQRVDRALLDELFRAFHTLKGLSSMVGVTAAEQLAHHVESYLRALRQGQAVLTPEAMTVLMGGTQALEQVIGARSAQQPPPDIEPIIARLAALTPGEEAALAGAKAPQGADRAVAPPELSLNDQDHARLTTSLANGARLWLVEFVPSAELSARGIDVNSVRARLQAAGELLRATPRIADSAKIAFDFLVAATLDASTLADWRADGLTATPYEDFDRLSGAAGPSDDDDRSPPEDTAQPSIVASNVVRVDLARLDDLMRMVGELVISRARLSDQLAHLDGRLPSHEARALQETAMTLERQIRDLRQGVMRVRMVPIRDVFARMQFVVRELARETGKQVRLALSGQETEIDKFVVERMLDPLLHLVRNAISHGIEPPAERVARGKPPTGTIALHASTNGDVVVIAIEDDGGGIDAERIADRARELGLIDGEHPLDEAMLLEIICSPDFSIRDRADLASGRGVGMAIVKTTIHELNGSFTLQTTPGRGARFTIRLPLTLAIVDALIVSAYGRTFAVPLPGVREALEVSPTALTVFEHNTVLSYRGGVLPIVSLSRFFDGAGPGDQPRFALVVGDGVQAIGIGVDRILGKREIVVRAITDALGRAPGIAGATELGDGRPVLILDVAAVVRGVKTL